jgi:hypothetical protein
MLTDRVLAAARAGVRMLALVVTALMSGPAALAHHSFRSQYDPDQVLNLTGYVTKIEWMNPHVYFYIDVVNAESGEVESWGFEMGPPHMLQNRGWKRNTMQIGDEIAVEGTRARDGSLTANARRVTMKATGEVLGAASSEGQTITAGGD